MKTKLAAFALGLLWSGFVMAASSNDTMDSTDPRGTIHLMVSHFNEGLGIHAFVPTTSIVSEGNKFPFWSLWFVKKDDVIKLLSCKESEGNAPHSITTESRDPIDMSWEKGILLERFLNGAAVPLIIAKDLYVQVTYTPGLDTKTSYTLIESKENQ